VTCVQSGRGDKKTLGAGMSDSAREPIRRQWKTLYDEAAENEPPPWAQPDLRKTTTNAGLFSNYFYCTLTARGDPLYFLCSCFHTSISIRTKPKSGGGQNQNQARTKT